MEPSTHHLQGAALPLPAPPCRRSSPFDCTGLPQQGLTDLVVAFDCVVVQVLLSICSLLTDPNPDDPLVPEIAQVKALAPLPSTYSVAFVWLVGLNI